MGINNKKNIYIKATNYFENGEIDKAIDKCEEGLSEDLKNSAVLNLKGLLLYLKGDLQGAIATWKVNSDFNDDNTAKNYLRDVKKDEERLEYYDRVQILLRNVKIDEAIKLLNKCKESDFNFIKVNIALATCYIRKGDYDLGSVYLFKALKIDKNNKLALEVSKQLKEYGGIKLEINKKTHKFRFLTIVIILLSVIAGVIYYVNDFDKKQNDINLVNSDNKNTKEDIENNKNEESETGKTNNTALVNIDDIENAINSKNYDLLYELIVNINKESLTEKEKIVYLKAVETIDSDEAIDYLYTEGLEKYMVEDYDNSKKEFEKVYYYGKSNYLYSHSIYFLGIINEKLNDKLEAIKYYEEYFNQYSDGIYIEEILYSLAILYKEVNLTKTKEYGTYLIYNYPNSIYNNDILNNLLKQVN